MKTNVNNVSLALLIGIFSAMGVYAQPNLDVKDIVVSIKPIALIVDDLLADRANVRVLVQPGSSPHDFSLRVSDMAAISEADLLIWMGPELERFLQRPLRQKLSKHVLTLTENTENKEQGKSAGSNHEHGDDPHIWLDPEQAQQIATKIAQFLIEQSPEQEAFIRRQLERVLGDYRNLALELEETFLPHKQTPFLVYHDGYHYLVEAFKLNQLAWITRSPEQAVGAKRLYELQQLLAAYDVSAEKRPGSESDKLLRPRCLFVESTHHSSSVKNIAKRLALQTYALDLLAADEAITSYRQLMTNIAEAMSACFAAD
ncbi:metal ABC transporter solute-binding protein, Zn/Mn family [Aurantivibrio infirmus]